MFQKYSQAINQFFSNPNNVRAALVLGTLLIAALAGGAPSDHSGG